MPKAPIPATYRGFPALTADEMREVDRTAAERHGLTTLELMERAGEAVARECLGFIEKTLGKKPADAAVVVVCGRGSNGGDGLVAARALARSVKVVSVCLVEPKKDGQYPEPVAVNLEKAKQSGVQLIGSAALADRLAGADLALDALLGTGASGKPAGPIRGMIQAVTRSKKPVLAVDIPSGIDPDTGYHSGVFITAAATLTLGFPKKGLLAPHAGRYVGELRVLDIGYPDGILKEIQR